MNLLKSFKEYAPALSALIILLALIHLSLYYLGFNVNITDYIELSELVILSAKKIIFLSIVSFFEAILFYPILKFPSINRIPQISEDLNSPKYKVIIRITYIIILIILPLSIYLKTHIFAVKLLMLTLAAFSSILILLTLIQEEYKLKFNKQINPRHIIISCSILAIVFFQILITMIDVQSTKNGRFVGSVIVLTDSTLVSTKENYYIGKTSKFIFIYNVEKRMPTAIPTENIKYISIADSEKTNYFVKTK